MKIKSKSDVVKFLSNFKKFAAKLHSGQHSFSFYDQKNKQYCYIILDDSSYILKTISVLSDVSETHQIKDINNFVWINRKYINKYIDRDAHIHYFSDLKQYY